MKKIITAVFFAAILLIAFPICAKADSSGEVTSEQALDDYYSTINEKIDSAIDDETKRSMKEKGIDGSDISNVGIFDVIKMIWNEFTSSISEPIKLLGRLAAVLILSSLAKSLAQNGAGASQTFMTVSVLGCITVIYQTIYQTFVNVCGFLNTLSEFMLSYIPIYASVTAASGGFSAGSSYYAQTLGICELIGFISQKVIMPFLSIFLALSFTSAINPDMKFSSVAESIKNAVRLTLTALMTIFTGLITIQSFAGSAADNAASRAVKFGASNFIPIIGGSVSEAYSTVYSSIGIIRSSVGSIGIAAVSVMLLKPLATIICVKLVLSAAKLISDLMGISEASELLKSTGYAMSAAISTVLCFSMMFIISTAVIMLTAANAYA
ncbi:MAG: hypothetical protein ACI4JW_02260 [Oscillospiraceae bacterium]